MLRALTLILLGLLLTLDGEPAELVVAVGDLAAAQSAGDDCCPAPPGEAEGEGDCCDFDFGRCCATGVVALAPSAPSVQGRRPASVLDQAQLSPDLLRPRTTGPPPTPPPIA